MPEVNPRRVASQKGRFAQVSAAVLAGMAAMFCLQNVVEFRREAARPAPLPSAAVEPSPALPAPEAVSRPAGPAPSSMLLKPEPGLGAGAAVVSVAGEEAPPRFEWKAPPPPAARVPKKKEMPRLQNRDMQSSFASSAVRSSGRFAPISYRERPEPVEAYLPPAPTARAPKRAAGSSGIKLIERADAPPENLQTALIAQIEPPKPIFWTKERKLNVGTALALMIFGIAYFVYASGIRDAPPERAEGEL